MDQVPRGKHCRLAFWWCKLLCLCQTAEHRVVDKTGREAQLSFLGDVAELSRPDIIVELLSEIAMLVVCLHFNEHGACMLKFMCV